MQESDTLVGRSIVLAIGLFVVGGRDVSIPHAH